MIRSIFIEITKNKRRPFWLGLILIIIVETCWFYASMIRTQSLPNKIFTLDQNYLLLMLMTVNGFFSPLFISILASRIVSIDFDNDMPSVLRVNNQNNRQLYTVKLLFGGLIVLIYWIIQLIIVMYTSKNLHIIFSGNLFVITMVCLLTGLIGILTFQMSIAFIISRQVVGILFGLVGSFIAMMTSGMLPQAVMRFIPMLYVSLVNPLILKSNTIIINPHILINLFIVFFVGLGIFLITEWYTSQKSEVW
ncbi:transporter [Leuconostoc mesenteroides subsp. dextranicum]|nr:MULTISPECIES: ABC transporter permease [Leuconostoc]KMY81005.1 transporter [Leuconostoc mesenteroides subsp. dextranicum]MBZ1519438.1 ABC transporter permease [Leuconostoc mesenteroides]MBZ1521494.1 ABC transporter permease [Leuconostoc mesenteroides]MBZ1523990.1 ABC transporter permease [Leuconostoc mesenteroides]MBZ1530071.1 ABC transporter permease [Leuconostoc mesenteroides]